MLRLGRRIGEKLICYDEGGNEIMQVVVATVKGNQVGLGIIADPKIKVMREELVLQDRRKVVQ